MAGREPAPEAVALRAWMTEQGMSLAEAARQMQVVEGTVRVFLRGGTRSVMMCAKAAALMAGRNVEQGPEPAVKEAILAAIERLHEGGVAYKVMARGADVQTSDFWDLRQRTRVAGWIWYKVLAWLEKERALPVHPDGGDGGTMGGRRGSPPAREKQVARASKTTAGPGRNGTPKVPFEQAENLRCELDAYIRANGLTGKAAAEEMGMCISTLAMLRDGTRDMRESHVAAIRQYLDRAKEMKADGAEES